MDRAGRRAGHRRPRSLPASCRTSSSRPTPVPPCSACRAAPSCRASSRWRPWRRAPRWSRPTRCVAAPGPARPRRLALQPGDIGKLTDHLDPPRRPRPAQAVGAASRELVEHAIGTLDRFEAVYRARSRTGRLRCARRLTYTRSAERAARAERSPVLLGALPGGRRRGERRLARARIPARSPRRQGRRRWPRRRRPRGTPGCCSPPAACPLMASTSGSPKPSSRDAGQRGRPAQGGHGRWCRQRRRGR